MQKFLQVGEKFSKFGIFEIFFCEIFENSKFWKDRSFFAFEWISMRAKHIRDTYVYFDLTKNFWSEISAWRSNIHKNASYILKKCLTSSLRKHAEISDLWQKFLQFFKLKIFFSIIVRSHKNSFKNEKITWISFCFIFCSKTTTKSQIPNKQHVKVV